MPRLPSEKDVRDKLEILHVKRERLRSERDQAIAKSRDTYNKRIRAVSYEIAVLSGRGMSNVDFALYWQEKTVRKD